MSVRVGQHLHQLGSKTMSVKGELSGERSQVKNDTQM